MDRPAHSSSRSKSSSTRPRYEFIQLDDQPTSLGEGQTSNPQPSGLPVIGEAKVGVVSELVDRGQDETTSFPLGGTIPTGNR